MKATRIKNKRTKRRGWEFRFTSPLTGRRTKKKFWFRYEKTARKAFERHLEALEARKIGLPSPDAWQLPYPKLLARFLTEAPIASDKQRAELKRVLEANELGIQIAADLAQVGRLTARCLKLQTDGERSAYYVVNRLQKFVKQLTRWGAAVGLLPSDPLRAWKRLPWGGHAKNRRAFTPEEIGEVLEAAAILDKDFGTAYPSGIVVKALLLTGNRPAAVFAATIGDLGAGRIHLPPGKGAKRNGMACLPSEFIGELLAYVQARKGAKASDPLLVSSTGCALDRRNFSRLFDRCLVLAAVRRFWPEDTTFAMEADPLDVAHLIYAGRQRGFDGPPARDPKKLAKRARHVQVTDAIAGRIGDEVAAWLKGRDLYALRKTHVSWARRITNADSVKLQVGHAPRDVEERHYLDLVDARESAKAVWDVLTGKRTLDGEHVEKPVLKVAAGGSSEGVEIEETDTGVVPEVVPGRDFSNRKAQSKGIKKPQPLEAAAFNSGGPDGTRTRNPRIDSPIL